MFEVWTIKAVKNVSLPRWTEAPRSQTVRQIVRTTTRREAPARKERALGNSRTQGRSLRSQVDGGILGGAARTLTWWWELRARDQVGGMSVPPLFWHLSVFSVASILFLFLTMYILCTLYRFHMCPHVIGHRAAFKDTAAPKSISPTFLI